MTYLFIKRYRLNLPLFKKCVLQGKTESSLEIVSLKYEMHNSVKKVCLQFIQVQSIVHRHRLVQHLVCVQYIIN